MIKPPIIVQPFVSRCDSLKVKLSAATYQWGGVAVFNSEKIPFADRTGPFFAQKIVTILVNRLKNLPSSSRYHIYELGCGNGILAKRILDILKTKHPHFYKKTILHATDVSPSMIKELQVLADFKRHSQHIVFEILDATQPKFTQAPIFAYCVNLIDSLPSRHIKIIDGQIFEVLTQTVLKPQAQVIDTTVYPPRLLDDQKTIK